MRPLCTALFAALLAAAGPARAATYVVNTIDQDLPDADTALAGCDGNPILAGDQCTLRAAIMQANAGSSADIIVLPLDATITLTIAGTGAAQSGDLDITQPVTITGAPIGYPDDEYRLPAIVAPNGDRVFDVTAGVAVTLDGLRLSGGNPSGLNGTNGGALRVLSTGADVTVKHSKISSNEAVDGGGISTAGTLTVLESELSSNRVSGNGSSLYVTGNGTATLRTSSVRVVEDTSPHAEAAYVAQGGALRIENSYFGGGTDPGEPTPTGGVFADRPQLLLIRNSTFTAFSTTGVEVVADGDTAVSLYNSIFAYSDGDDCKITTLAGSPPDVRISYNLFQTQDCNAYLDVGNIFGTDPLLEPGTSSAGSFTIARRVYYGSPVVDLGAPANQMGGDPQMACLGTDQRGGPRPLDGNADNVVRCDMGAIEAEGLVSTTYVVNTFDQDLVDVDLYDGNRCDGNAALAGDQCTLRAALMQANAHNGPDRIEFAPGEHTVTLTIPGNVGSAQGDLDVTDTTVISGQLENGRPITTITTNQQQRLFDVDLPTGYTARFENLRLVGADATALAGDVAGGAIRFSSDNFFKVDTVEFADNVANTRGGAINLLDGELLVQNSDFHGNSVANSLGAAIYAQGQLSVEGSSFWNNQNGSLTEREAIRVEGKDSMIMFNTTISGNSGGIWAEGNSGMDVRQTTIYDNAQYGLRAVKGAGGLLVALKSTVIDHSGTQDCSVVNGATLLADYNLVEDGSCAQGGTNVDGDPKLAPALAQLDNELSRVHFPLDGSALIDVLPEDDVTFTCLDIDQRDNVRPTDSDGVGGAKCEIGAVELFLAEAAPRNFTVNIYGQDRDDSNPGDAFCDTSSSPGIQCTLRAAVMEANALPGLNVIQLPQAGATAVLTQAPEAGTSAAHGDLDITDTVSIEGVSGSPGVRPTVSASMGERIFNVNAPGKLVAIYGLKLTGGNSPGSGGALRVVAGDVEMERVGMYGNTAALGGGAVSVTGGSASLLDVDMLQNGTAGEGAAIRVQGELTLSRSSVRNNPDLSPIGQREAIAVVGGGTLFVLNSTIAGNNGNGIDVDDGTLDVENATIVGNGQRGIEFQRITGRTLFLRNTILTGNADGGCTLVGAGFPTASVDGYNFAQSYGCTIESGPSNVVESDAQLGALVVDPAKYTAYYLPQPGSPVRDTGHPIVGGVGCLANDQLGTARAIDGDGNGSARCDVGAIEAATAIAGDELFTDSFEVGLK